MNNVWNLSIAAFFLINSIGYVKFYTSNFWTKNTKSNKELTVNHCQYIFKEVNDIHHFVKAYKIKVPDHLSCYRRVFFQLNFIIDQT